MERTAALSIWVSNQGERKCCQRLASRETNIKRKHCSITMGVCVGAHGGGIMGLLRPQTQITKELFPWF